MSAVDYDLQTLIWIPEEHKARVLVHESTKQGGWILGCDVAGSDIKIPRDIANDFSAMLAYAALLGIPVMAYVGWFNGVGECTGDCDPRLQKETYQDILVLTATGAQKTLDI